MLEFLELDGRGGNIARMPQNIDRNKEKYFKINVLYYLVMTPSILQLA